MDAVGATFSGSLTEFPRANAGRTACSFSCSEELEPINRRVGQFSQRRMNVFNSFCPVLGSSCIPYNSEETADFLDIMLSTVFLTKRDNLFRERSSTTAQLTEAPWNGLQDDSQKKIWKKSALLLLLLCPSSQRSFLHEHAVAGIGSLLKCVDGQPFPWWWPCPVLPPYLNAQRKVKITVKFNSKLNLKTAYSLSELQQDRWTPHCNSPNSPWQMPGKYSGSLNVHRALLPDTPKKGTYESL